MITTTGEVLDVLSERTNRVRLPNGKVVIAHPSREMFERREEIVPGVMVALEMTPFDFDKARIAEVVR